MSDLLFPPTRLPPLSLPPPPPPPPPPGPKDELIAYYTLLFAITAATVYAIIKSCQTSRRRSNQLVGITVATSNNQSLENPRTNLLSSFKYKTAQQQEQGSKDKDSDSVCAVCLCVFEEGEEARQLPVCKHCFHASCIDMWLYSHHDCPLCRAPVTPPPPPPPACHRQIEMAENSRVQILYC